MTDREFENSIVVFMWVVTVGFIALTVAAGYEDNQFYDCRDPAYEFKDQCRLQSQH